MSRDTGGDKSPFRQRALDIHAKLWRVGCALHRDWQDRPGIFALEQRVDDLQQQRLEPGDGLRKLGKPNL